MYCKLQWHIITYSRGLGNLDLDLDLGLACRAHGSFLFLLPKEALSHPQPERQRHFINHCYESYWEPQDSAIGSRPSYEELFPFDQLKHIMQGSFLGESAIQRILFLIEALETAVQSIYLSSQHTDTWSAPEEDISCALMSYYRLFWNILKDSDLLLKGLNLQKDSLYQEGYGYRFLRIMLNLGCCFERKDISKHIVGIVTPFAPRYLSAILETGQLLTEFDNQAPDERLKSNAEVLNTFIGRFLRWFLLAPDGTLCHAAARPTTSIPQEWADICVVIRPISDYSSFEGISELRLFEKVRYEMERLVKQREQKGQEKRWDSFRILIAGDIDAGQILKFGRMLEGWLETEFVSPVCSDTKITFSLFTNNCSFDELISVGWTDCLQSFHWLRMDAHPMAHLFGDPGSLKRQVDQADLLFFLDCQQLYDDFYVAPCANLSAFFQQTSDPNIEFVHQSASGHVLSPNNPFFLIQNLLLGILYGKGGPALLKKEVSTTWLNFIWESLKLQNKTAYFYYSDLDAAQDLYWREDCFVRSENYAGKRMVILRYDANEEPKLQSASSDQEKTIVFNLWQFIKHSNLRRVDTLMSYFGLCAPSESESAERICLLSRILIGIDYSDWPNVLHLTYSYPSDMISFQKPLFEDHLKHYLDDIIFPCFQRDTNNIYYSYFRSCIASFLYSDAKSIDDMLFIHIFERQFSLLRSISLKPEKDYQKLLALQPNGLKYSGKRFYQEVMNDYDEPSYYVPDQHRKLTLMEKSGKLLPAKVFCDIRKACEENQYSNSNLYRNCTKWLVDNNYHI